MTRSLLDHLSALCSLPLAGALPELGRTLNASERLSPEELLRHQLLRAEVLVDHAARTVPLYETRFRRFLGRPLTIDRFRELPLLTRADLRDRASELSSREPPSGHHVVRETRSSGSTGVPVVVQVDGVSETVRRVLTIRDHAWHRRDLTAKLASIRAVDGGTPNAPRDRRWSHHPRSGVQVVLDVSTPITTQLAWLVREAPTYLATYATNAAALIALAEQKGVSLPSLREIGTLAEILPEGTREACARVFGVPLCDGYSASEVGYIAFECAEARRYHVQAEHLLLEVLRPDGSPCAPGETGRVVLTALHAFAMPLVRYELGDFATVGEPCPCGRGLPVLERIVGRVRNMMVLPDGGRYWPRFGSLVLHEVAPLKQFRLVQKSVTHLELELVAHRPLREEEEARVKAIVLATLDHPFELALRHAEEIPRSAGGKFEDFISEVPLPPTS